MMPQLLAHLFGDYVFQSSWMAENKTKRSWPAFVHALLYSLCFVWLCWVPTTVNQRPSTCVTFIDKFGAETTCADANSKVPDGAAGYKVYAAADSKIIPTHFRWLPWLVIFGTHFLIDRFRLARYVVWAKNWMGPWTRKYVSSSGGLLGLERYELVPPNQPLAECPTGYLPSTPIWMATWLLILADNTCHLAINYAALRYL